jgi:hypothetical protein
VLGIHARKLVQSVVEGNNIELAFLSRYELLIQGQLSGATQLSAKVSGLEARTTGQMADASKHIETRMSDLDQKVVVANNAIAAQQSKLISTNELVTAMFSKGQVETFQTDRGSSSTFATVPLSTPEGAPKNTPKAVVYMLLKNAPIYQTVQINFHVFIQLKNSYFIQGMPCGFSGVTL